jgi:hypothetical protein
MVRYCTCDEAAEGHNKLVTEVKIKLGIKSTKESGKLRFR